MSQCNGVAPKYNVPKCQTDSGGGLVPPGVPTCVSTTDRCSDTKVCPKGMCCSLNGYCGVSDEYCLNGGLIYWFFVFGMKSSICLCLFVLFNTHTHPWNPKSTNLSVEEVLY